MNVRALLSLLGLASLASLVSSSSWGVRQQACPRKSKAVLSIPRGGGVSLIEPELAAKIFIGAYGINAAACAVLPKQTMKGAYGVDMGDAEAWIGTTIGFVGLNTAVLLYLQQMQGMAFGKALGFSVIPYLTMNVYRLLTDANQVVGMPKSELTVDTLMNVAVLVANLSEQSWASKLNVVYGLFSLFFGAWFYLLPEAAAAAKKITTADTPQSKFLHKAFGYFLLGHAAAVCTIGGVLKSIGYTALAVAAPILGLVADGSFTEAGVPIPPALAWVALLLAIGASLVL